jgi:hypothetical protein
MSDLPPHLQALNSAQPSPPSHMSQEVEDAVWDFLHTDELFRNFGNSTIPPPPTPNVDVKAQSLPNQPADLKSFIAQFAPEATVGSFNPANLNFAGIAGMGMGMGSGSGGVSTMDVLPGYGAGMTPGWDMSVDSPDEGRVSGAKKLKQLGAGQAEIEEESVEYSP